MTISDWLDAGKPIDCIVQGDCLEGMEHLADKSVDLVLTDPPYGINIASNGKVGGEKCCPVTNYGIQTWDRVKLPPEYFKEIFRISKNQVIFGGNYYGSVLGDTSCYLVWDKDNTGNFADCELAWTSFKTAVRKIKWRWNGMLQEDMKHKEIRYHPTQKPVPVFSWILANYSNEDDLILDPFLGSGTTAIAAIRTGRHYLGFELDPQYYEMAVKRIGYELQQTTLQLEA